MDIIKVSGSSRTSAVAGAIAGVFREHKHADVQAIGAGAVNQAVKALVLATGYLAADGLDVVFVPEFVDVEIDGKTRTAVRLVVELRYGSKEEAPVATFSEDMEEEAPVATFSEDMEEEAPVATFSEDMEEEPPFTPFASETQPEEDTHLPTFTTDPQEEL